MRIEHYEKSGDLHVKLCGELDEHSSSYVRLTLDMLIDNGRAARLYIDMSELSFMDSTGVGVLIGRYKKLKPRGVPIYIQSPQFAVDKILRLSGIYNIMLKVG